MNLTYWRNLRHLSISELSSKSTVPIRTIEDIEKRGSCKIDTARKLAEALNINLYDLATDYSYTGGLWHIDLKDVLDYLLQTMPLEDFQALLSDINTYEHGIHMKAMDKAYQLCEDIHKYGIDKVHTHWEKSLPQW